MKYSDLGLVPSGTLCDITKGFYIPRYEKSFSASGDQAIKRKKADLKEGRLSFPERENICKVNFCVCENFL